MRQLADFSVTCTEKGNTMENKERHEKIARELFILYEMRLSAFIGDGSESKDTVRRIIERFLAWAEEDSRREGNETNFSRLMNHIDMLLDYRQNIEDKQTREWYHAASVSATEKLCSYVQYLYGRLCRDIGFSDEELRVNKYDLRKTMGQKFAEKVRNTYKDILPKDRIQEIYEELNYVTLARNTFAHPQEQGLSLNYEGYKILIGNDAILACLLYTFYYMIIKEEIKLETP